LSIAWAQSESYFVVVSTSTLTSDKAYWSYYLYLWPKLSYPLACTTLTQQQCKYFQAPTLAAVFPKMFLNRQTPHAVIFGKPKYGGLSIPDLITDQGYGQLKLIGHLKSNDQNGSLLHITITQVQLWTGALNPFSPYPTLLNIHPS
jgi:hypothetical protein